MIARTRVLLSELLELHYLPQNLQIGPLSAEQYRTLGRLLDRWQTRPVYADEFSREFVLGFLAWLRSQGRSNGTLNSKRGLLRPLWAYAHEHGFCPEPPCPIRRLREPKRIPEAWTIEEVAALLSTAWRLPGRLRNGLPRSAWWTLLIFLCFYTGLRIKSVRKLRWSWLRADGSIRVPAEEVKEFRERLFWLPPIVVALAGKVRLEGDDRLLPWPNGSRALWKFWRTRIVLASGLPAEPRKSGFHRLRKTYASYLERARPGTAAQLLHADPRITRDRYIDPTIAGGFNPVELLPALTLPWQWDGQRRLFD